MDNVHKVVDIGMVKKRYVLILLDDLQYDLQRGRESL